MNPEKYKESPIFATGSQKNSNFQDRQGLPGFTNGWKVGILSTIDSSRQTNFPDSDHWDFRQLEAEVSGIRAGFCVATCYFLVRIR